MRTITASIRLADAELIAPVDERLYSSFIEHMGRAVYTGIYEPGHPSADEQGFRKDVAELIRPLQLSHIRYPGGNFLSGYNWRDGVGPKASRPVRPELAWFALEPNEVGTDEFLQWCERIGTNAMLEVNLGTGTPQDAAALLEYVNGDLPTYYAEQRRKNGHAAPYGVKLWCLGNEMDGPWQICGKTADEYGRIACETAKMMKWLDPSVELVACGSSFHDMPTFGNWERTVLRHCYQHIDYLSLHQYYRDMDRDVPTFLARSLEMDDFIHEVAAICSEVREELGAEKKIGLSFDEWNVWYHYERDGEEPPRWSVARPIHEEPYNLCDALVVGLMMNTLLRNTDTVKIACLAQLVNALAAIMTEPGGRAYAQTIYYPFLLTSQYGRGTSLRIPVDVQGYDCACAKDVPYLDCAAVRRDDGRIALFLVNRSQTDGVTPLFDERRWRVERAIVLSGDPAAVNTADAAPIVPKPLPVDEGIVLLPLSWTMLLLREPD